MLFLPACRTAWQGMMVPDHAETISKPPPANGPRDVPSASRTNGNDPKPDEQPQSQNLLADFAGNEFNAWTISHHIDIPVGQKRAEDSPVPRPDER
jgi:hypothetical protein